MSALSKTLRSHPVTVAALRHADFLRAKLGEADFVHQQIADCLRTIDLCRLQPDMREDVQRVSALVAERVMQSALRTRDAVYWGVFSDRRESSDDITLPDQAHDGRRRILRFSKDCRHNMDYLVRRGHNSRYQAWRTETEIDSVVSDPDGILFFDSTASRTLDWKVGKSNGMLTELNVALRRQSEARLAKIYLQTRQNSPPSRVDAHTHFFALKVGVDINEQCMDAAEELWSSMIHDKAKVSA